MYHHKGQVKDIYTPSVVPTYVNRPNCWSRSRVDVPLEDIGDICTVKEVGNIGVHNVASYAPRPPIRTTPTNFWEVIQG